jgi:hypothetical protein
MRKRKKIMNVTANEIAVLNDMAHHEMNPGNGARPTCAADVCTFCWVEDFGPGLTLNQVKGVVSSLVKKGLIVVSEDDEHNVVDFTDAGFAVFEEHC